MAAEEARPDSSRCTLELKLNPFTKARRSKKIKSGNYTHVHCFPRTGRLGALVRDPKDGRACELGFTKFVTEERDLGNLPSDYKDETHRDKGGEDHSPDERSSDVVPQCSWTSFEHGVYGTQPEDGAEGNGSAIVCVDNTGLPAPASPVVSFTPTSWIGKRRRTSRLSLPSGDEKEAIRGLLLLSKGTA